jgi:Holliday junction DNA helicase RuvA
MLAYLTGTIQAKEISNGPSDHLILDVHGIGFELNVSRRTMLSLGDIGDQVTIDTVFVVRENDWTIFGFADTQERKIFQLLQTVSGIGPKLALSLVGTLGANSLLDAILTEDNKSISQAPGVGQKVAQRIILELKSKASDLMNEIGMSQQLTSSAYQQNKAEVHGVLKGLGYTDTEINLALEKAKEENIEDDVEILVRFCLKTLGAAMRS